MYDKSPTRLATVLRDIERSQSWLARKLGIAPQSVNIWVHGKEACPRARQAQIVVFINDEQTRGRQLTIGYLFDARGLAIREE